MARIRTIKPDFFTSEDIVGLTPLARLLFIATWLEADREGRLEWKPNTLKMRYLPADTCAIATLCDELVGAGLVVLYNEGLAYIPGFTKHQNINGKELASKLPAPPTDDLEHSRGARVLDASARVVNVSLGDDGKCAVNDVLAREVDASSRVIDAPSLPSPSFPFPSGGGVGGTTTSLRPIHARRNLRAAFEHPRFDVPDWWHLEKMKGLPGGERDLLRFYSHLAEHVDTHPGERTEPRKKWLTDHFEAWLALSPQPVRRRSDVPDVEETRRMLDARERKAQS